MPGSLRRRRSRSIDPHHRLDRYRQIGRASMATNQNLTGSGRSVHSRRRTPRTPPTRPISIKGLTDGRHASITQVLKSTEVMDRRSTRDRPIRVGSMFRTTTPYLRPLPRLAARPGRTIGNLDPRLPYSACQRRPINPRHSRSSRDVRNGALAPPNPRAFQ